jgi:Tol biopolymer transport system component
VSPDGARLALATQDDIWIYDIARAMRTKLTDHPTRELSPLWSPDSQRIIFTSEREGYRELFSRSADGTGRDERLLTRGNDLIDLMANGWSADGHHLLFSEISSPSTVVGKIGQIALERPSDVTMLLDNRFNNGRPAVSPSGSWMAYDSDMSGRPEIYVERYPGLGNRQPISSEGGRLPMWSRTGRELFFSTPDGRQMFAVPVQSGATFVAGRPQPLFEFAMLTNTGGNRPVDIAPDGRFFIIRGDPAQDGSGTPPSNLIIVQDWFQELKRMMPVN